MICRECGATVRAVSFLHLKKCCGMTPADYKLKHPGQPMVDDDIKLKTAHNGCSNGRWKGGISQPTCEICNKQLSKHSYVKRCNKCKQVGELNPFHGCKHTKESKEKISQSHLNRSPKSYATTRGRKLPNTSKARIAYWNSKSHDEKSSLLKNFIQAGQKHNKKSKGTKIENWVNDILQEFAIDIKRNEPYDSFNIDFIINDFLGIECYGDFWHCNPKLYPADYFNKSLKMTSVEKWTKDELRIKNCESKGLTILIVWEYDIKNCPEYAKKQVTDFMEKHDLPRTQHCSMRRPN
jgi:G:T-mismatch repair DNA endonuclease (very short patch repair protein)